MGLNAPRAGRPPAHRTGRGAPRRGETPGLAARKTAASLYRQVIERGVLLDALTDEAHGAEHFRALDARDHGLTRAIVGTALRRRGEIAEAVGRCLDRPLPPNSGALSAILHVGAAQILFMDVPDHAAVSLAVAHATSDRTARNARGLANSVLRRIARERGEILGRPGRARMNAPEWLFARWSAAYGEDTAQAIVEAHLVPPGLDLSVKRDPELWAERLGGIVLPTGTVRLPEARRVSALPGYAEGAWWVQDAAAALPARLLRNVAGKRVVDLCAAPGGKTAELASAGAVVTAVDISESRLRRLSANLARLQLTAELECADILAWDPGSQFEAVLLDAPCSATGTIRRHPDVQWLKKPEDIVTLASLQARMLDRAAALVVPGGLLVFCTCSLEPEEGEAQVLPFLARHPEFSIEPVHPTDLAGLAHLVSDQGTLRTLPCHSFESKPGADEQPSGTETQASGMDGFFAARFRRGSCG